MIMTTRQYGKENNNKRKRKKKKIVEYRICQPEIQDVVEVKERKVYKENKISTLNFTRDKNLAIFLSRLTDHPLQCCLESYHGYWQGPSSSL